MGDLGAVVPQRYPLLYFAALFSKETITVHLEPITHKFHCCLSPPPLPLFTFSKSTCLWKEMNIKRIFFWLSLAYPLLINGLRFVCTALLDPHALGSLYSICDTLLQLVKIVLVHDLVKVTR